MNTYFQTPSFIYNHKGYLVYRYDNRDVIYLITCDVIADRKICLSWVDKILQKSLSKKLNIELNKLFEEIDDLVLLRNAIEK